MKENKTQKAIEQAKLFDASKWLAIHMSWLVACYHASKLKK